ncbi:3-deoxy-manno-octulosonate cytidylyltransferase [bacterium]|nr:3-deoxy-manno-octulosonate cytidylyltransferase [bacterium]
MKTVIIIPARYASTRLNAKPLIKVGGKPVIQWVYEQAKTVTAADEVIVATDNQEIFDTVKSFGGEVEMTSAEHKSGTDRIAEVISRHPEYDLIVNLQGDEPLISTQNITTAIELLKNDSQADIATLVKIVKDKDEIENPNLVKCIFDKNNYAIYFSRNKLPYERTDYEDNFYGHIGLYCYTKNALLTMTKLPQANIEKAESLEQLRAIYNGLKIKVAVVESNAIGIDTKEDLQAFENYINSKKS